MPGMWIVILGQGVKEDPAGGIGARRRGGVFNCGLQGERLTQRAS